MLVKNFVFPVRSKATNKPKPSTKITQSGRWIHCKYTDIIDSFNLKWSLILQIVPRFFHKNEILNNPNEN